MMPTKKKRIRPAQRTLEWLRKHGALAHKTEVWNAFAGPPMPDGSRRGARQDMFGLVDVLCLWPNRTDFIQCCGVDVASHLTKISSSVDLKARLVKILEDDSRKFYIIAWRERKLKNMKRPEWVIRVLAITRNGIHVEITPEDYLAFKNPKIFPPSCVEL